jgi:hypothetical protein
MWPKTEHLSIFNVIFQLIKLNFQKIRSTSIKKDKNKPAENLGLGSLGVLLFYFKMFF